MDGFVKKNIQDFICGRKQHVLVKLSGSVFISRKFPFLIIQSMIIETTTACSTQVVHLKNENMLKLNVVELFNMKM